VIRKTIGLFFALALVGAGAYLLYLQIFHSSVIEGQYLFGASIFGFIGLAWLWADYIRPLLGHKDKSDA
jgi:hypothetical protein